MTPADMIFASPKKRVLALLIDACLCLAIWLILDLVGATFQRQIIFFIFFGWLAFAIPTWRKGGSLGTLLLGLQVCDLKGKRPRIVRSSCRALLSMLSTGIFGMGYALMLLNDKRQTLHDMYTNTLVLDAKAMQSSHESETNQNTPLKAEQGETPQANQANQEKQGDQTMQEKTGENQA